VFTSLLAGLGLGLSLIVAIGAQNLFVLRQGLRREHILAVALICTASDVILILLGVSGVGLALQALPWLVTLVRWVGAVFLLGYGLLALRRAIRPSASTLATATAGPAEDAALGAPGSAGGSRGAPLNGITGSVAVAARAALAPVVLTCLALTWLNPHVYLDTVFLLGSVANTHGDARWWFALGAGAASAGWFFGLAFGARLLGRWLATPRAWRVLDGGIAVVMIGIAVHLAFSR
jgi:L-lysine exporter family protein LysE/ArgO